jgi:hypothetical protein
VLLNLGSVYSELVDQEKGQIIVEKTLVLLEEHYG